MIDSEIAKKGGKRLSNKINELQSESAKKDGETLPGYAIGYLWGGQVCYEVFDGPVAFLQDGGEA